MNRRQLFLVTAGLLTVTGALAASQYYRRSSTRSPRIVTTKDTAYLVGKVEHVLAGEIKEVVAAPGGRYVLITQSLRPEPTEEIKFPYGEEKLWLYDARRRTTTLLHRTQDNPVTRTYTELSVNWFPEGGKALVTLNHKKMLPNDESLRRTSCGLVDAERKVFRNLNVSAPHDSLQEAHQIPEGNLLLLISYYSDDDKTFSVSFLSPTGTLTPPSTLPMGMDLVGTLPASREVVFEEGYSEKQAGKIVVKTRWHALNASGGATRVLLQRPKDLQETPQPLPELALKLLDETAELKGEEGHRAETRSLWLEATVPSLEKKYTRALVTAEAESNTTLLADLSAVLYVHDDALYAAPIASLDRLAFEKLMRQLALSNAKTIGIGLMMYCQDYDEIFPQNPATVKDAIFPYIKSNDTLADFVYTYKGPLDSSKLDKPEETELGYVSAPGGRAIIYADGHAKWEPQR